MFRLNIMQPESPDKAKEGLERLRHPDEDVIGNVRNSIEDIGLKEHLVKYLELKKPDDINRIRLVSVSEVIVEHPQYKKQFEFLNDKRLHDIKIGIVPKNLWVKGKQPSESHAERNLILFREDYFNDPDEIGWMTHELAHCLRYLDSKNTYASDSQTFAYDDIRSEYPYPNNKVEAFTFRKQFEYLKKQEITKEEVIVMLKEQYSDEDFPFFEKVLNQVFTK